MTSLPLNVTWEDILWQMLTCCGLTVSCTYKIVKVRKIFKKVDLLFKLQTLLYNSDLFHLFVNFREF